MLYNGHNWRQMQPEEENVNPELLHFLKLFFK